MESFIKVVEKKIRDNVEVDKIEIINSSSKHQGHKSFTKGKFHLKIQISFRCYQNILVLFQHLMPEGLMENYDVRTSQNLYLRIPPLNLEKYCHEKLHNADKIERKIL